MFGQQKHHKIHRDSSSIFKERSLRALHYRKIIEKTIKIALLIIAILMAIAVVLAYKFG